jgi:hypothetical protein
LKEVKNFEGDLLPFIEKTQAALPMLEWDDAKKLPSILSGERGGIKAACPYRCPNQEIYRTNRQEIEIIT